MVATWIQSWRLASLRMRLTALLQEPQASRPTIMFHTVSRPIFREGKQNERKSEKSATVTLLIKKTRDINWW